MTDKKLMFIKIPRNGGSEISKLLYHKFEWSPTSENFLQQLSKFGPRIYINRIDPLFLLERENKVEDYHKFTVARNPYTRAYSFYMFLSHKSNKYIGFEQFLNLVKINKNIFDSNVFKKPMISSADTLYFTQSFFLENSKGLIDINRIYYFEKPEEIENDFNIKLNLKKHEPLYYETDFYAAYTKEAIDIVKEIYYEDFINFNYSFDFV
jgi:hypothetical protein